MSGRMKFVFATAVLAVLLVGAAALAQTGDGTGRTATDYRQAFLDRLAAILGVDRSRLDGAVRQAGGDVIGQMEQDGVLSAQQADWMRQRIEQGDWPAWGMGHWGRHRGWHGGWKGIGNAELDAAAGALGITRDELTAQLKDGKTLGEIADARGVDRQKVQDAVVAAYKQRLDQAVQNGDLTQKQADNLLQRFSSLNIMDKPLGRCGWKTGTGSGGATPSGTSATPAL